MSYRAYSFLFSLVMLAMVGAELFANGKARQEDFEKSQRQIMETLVTAVTGEISSLIANLHRQIHVFAKENEKTIAHLAHDPEDEGSREWLAERVGDHFPGYSAFTITDQNGTPLLEDIDQRVSELCRHDIRQFAKAAFHDQTAHQNRVRIHPQPHNYHFDVMAPWKSQAQQGVFFVSFRADLLTELLKNRQLPDLELLVLKEDQPNLVEMAADGSRDTMQRNIELTPEEEARIEHVLRVPGTLWETAVLPRAELYSDYRHRILTQSGFVMLAFLLVCGVMMTLVTKQERQRNFAEAALRNAYERQELQIAERARDLKNAERSLQG